MAERLRKRHAAAEQASRFSSGHAWTAHRRPPPVVVVVASEASPKHDASTAKAAAIHGVYQYSPVFGKSHSADNGVDASCTMRLHTALSLELVKNLYSPVFGKSREGSCIELVNIVTLHYHLYEIAYAYSPVFRICKNL